MDKKSNKNRINRSRDVHVGSGRDTASCFISTKRLATSRLIDNLATADSVQSIFDKFRYRQPFANGLVVSQVSFFFREAESTRSRFSLMSPSTQQLIALNADWNPLVGGFFGWFSKELFSYPRCIWNVRSAFFVELFHKWMKEIGPTESASQTWWTDQWMPSHFISFH